MSPRRKQLAIPGTERPVHEDIEAAAEAYREARDERMELSKREKQKQLELLAVMRAHKVSRYKYDDAEGEELLVSVDEEPKIKVKKTGEAESEIGEGIDDDGTPSEIHPGLIAQALAAQAEAGVEETDDGDVIAPSGNGARKPKGKRRSKKAN